MLLMIGLFVTLAVAVTIVEWNSPKIVPKRVCCITTGYPADAMVVRMNRHDGFRL